MTQAWRVSLLALLLPSGALAQRPAGVPPDTTQRATLEARVLQRFVERTAADLSLTGEQRQRFEELFHYSVERRRQFARASLEARRALAAAVRERSTSDTEFERQLTALESLRQRDHELWLLEQRTLAELLTTRQRALYMARWLSLQDNIRDVMARRGARGGPPRR